MPLIRNLPFHACRMRSTQAQSIAAFCPWTPFMSMPLYMGRSLLDGPAPPLWHPPHELKSLPRRRKNVSLFRPAVRSTVNASTVTPAACTRSMILAAASH